MASPLNPNRLFLLQRTISIREATTTDGFTIMANKHYTYHIEEGTLNDAIQNGYIDSHEALKARTMKARSIARMIMERKRRLHGTLVEIIEHLSDSSDIVTSDDTARNASSANKTDDLVNPTEVNVVSDVAKAHLSSEEEKVKNNDESSSSSEDETSDD